MYCETVLKNVLVLRNGKLLKENIGLVQGRIAQIANSDEKIPALQVIDCSENILLPGLIDSHVHFRFPGDEHKEEWETASAAALVGGVTTVLDMPNTRPPLTAGYLLDEKRMAVSKKSKCGFGFHFGVSARNFHELEKVNGVCSFKVFMGSSTGDLLVDDGALLEKVFRIAKKRDIVVCVHAEDEQIIRANAARAKAEGRSGVRVHNVVRSCEAEATAIAKALQLQEKIKNKLHILHVSSKDGIELIANAKQRSSLVTCEVTPHHLFLTDEDVVRLGNLGKMNPSLKAKADQNALWKGIANGTVDTVGSDHAPHTLGEKQQDYWQAPSGVPGIETMLPLLLHAVCEEKLSLQKIAQLCAQNPARIFGIANRGQIKIGFDADLVLVNLNGITQIKNEHLKTKCKWSPFDGWRLKGKIEKVFKDGKGCLG